MPPPSTELGIEGLVFSSYEEVSRTLPLARA